MFCGIVFDLQQNDVNELSNKLRILSENGVTVHVLMNHAVCF